jgi:cephalosporin-C deacetylase-like acetyl esterase
LKFLLAVLVGVFGGPFQPACAQDSYSAAAKHFDYDAHASLDVKEISVQERNGVKIHDITYASPKGGVVPAYLVVPNKGGKFAAILWGHWMMANSPTANRSEFLEEAIALAPAGVVSLLIDAPYVRPGFKPDPDPLGSQNADVTAQQVIDLRRSLDLLMSREDVDPQRVAFVGHSFDATCGAILDAVDKRPAAFVFVGNPESTRELLLTSEYPQIVSFRNSVPAEKLNQYLETYYWSDAATYAGHLGPAPVLFQYATRDEFVPVAAARHYLEMSSGPKEMKFYDSDHALNAEARHDRYEFLRKRLNLPMVPSVDLEKVPQTK